MKKFISLVLGIAVSSGLWAQTSSFMDALLKTPAVSWGQASYLILVASNNLAEDVTEQRSFELLQQLHWAGSDVQMDSPINLSQYSYLLMRAFGIHGGMWYSMFPCPRYAFRELSFRLILSQGDDPDSRLDGTEAIRILGRVMDIWSAKKGAAS